jgi:hypothetical protein
MLTVCCVWVRGPVNYTADYVVRLERMVRRYLARPFDFVCFTDRREELPGSMLSVYMPSMTGVVPGNGCGYWSKIRLFDPSYAAKATRTAGHRVLYIDLDSLIVSDLSPIVDFPAPFAITEDALVKERAHLDTDKHGRQLIRAFNSSVMVWDVGFGEDIFTEWTPAVALRLSTDQDWIAERYPNAAAMPYSWFPRISQLRKDPQFEAFGAPMPPEAKVILSKKPKNSECAKQMPWFDAAWGGWH